MNAPFSKYALPLCLTALWIFCLGGCASLSTPQPPRSQLQELEQIQPRTHLDHVKQSKPPGPPPFAELMSPPAKDVYTAPQIYSLIFDKAELGEVVAALVRDTDYNLSIESEVDLSKPITVQLKNVTLKESLDMIVVNAAGYAWEIGKGTLYVKRFVERIYQIDYLDLVSKTDIDIGGDMLASGVEESGVAGKFQVQSKSPEGGGDLWGSIEKSLAEMKSSAGVLRVNRNAGVVYMADTPRNVAAMVRFLDSLTDSLHRQVFIEARIMEVQLFDENQYGIDWTNLNWQFQSSWPDVLQLAMNGGTTIGKGPQSVFQAVLDLLRTQGDVRVISNPHLSVMNRQSAVMTVGFQFPYTDIDGVDRDQDTGVITIGASIKRAVLGLQLGLTPQISKEGVITFHIVPTLTRIDREVEVDIPITGLASQAISNPVIDLQELSTTVRVREGNSFVLAGLISKIRNMNHEGLPLLGDIPLLGHLFRHSGQVERSSELVILVTPYILEQP